MPSLYQPFAQKAAKKTGTASDRYSQRYACAHLSPPTRQSTIHGGWPVPISVSSGSANWRIADLGLLPSFGLAIILGCTGKQIVNRQALPSGQAPLLAGCKQIVKGIWSRSPRNASSDNAFANDSQGAAMNILVTGGAG
jgi:hypothetical protein